MTTYIQYQNESIFYFPENLVFFLPNYGSQIKKNLFLRAKGGKNVSFSLIFEGINEIFVS